MSFSRSLALVLLSLVLWVATARAHHSFAPVYDAKRTITVEGIVTQFRFVNPHAMMFMDVTDKEGKVVKWVVEFDGNLNLSERGWTADSIKAHERVTVTGNPTHTNSPKMFFVRLVRPDGTELLREDRQRSNAIEEERRQRALQRNR
jgi:Family of unknown function (DUF6152)